MMAAVMLISMFGCSVNKKNTEVSDKDGAVVDIDSITNKDGDAVIKNETTDKNGKKVETTELVDADSIDTPVYSESTLIKSENFVSEIAGKNFDLPEDKAKDVVNNKDNWKAFYVTEYIQNKTDKHMAFRSVSVENNGKNGIWVNKELDADFTFAPGVTEAITIWALADTTKLKDDDAIDKAFGETKINLIYTLIDDPMDDVDWSKAEIKEFVIH